MSELRDLVRKILSFRDERNWKPGKSQEACCRRKIQFRGYSPALASANDARVRLPAV
jgi:hypothetical protein